MVLISLFLLLVLAFELQYFTTGFLGAIALYAVVRRYFLYLTERKRWNKLVSTLWILFLIIVSFGVPLWLLLEILIPQINDVIDHPQEIIKKFNPVVEFIQGNEYIQRLDFQIDNEQLITIVNRVLSYIPSTLNWVGNFFANIFVALFILYFMLMSNRTMEAQVKALVPLSEGAKNYFITANLELIRSNAYGVPILAVSQGLIAIVGYSIFGVEKAVFWGLLTGVASIVPVVGTMVVWIPICIYQIATGQMDQGLMLALYCLILVGGIDNVLRFTLLKKMADIHPLITVFGVVVGLKLFGAMGLVFGPLLLSLPFVLYQTYTIERGQRLEPGPYPGPIDKHSS